MNEAPEAFLSGKVAWVTGSTRGVGHAIAARLARAGADVVVHGRRPGGPGAASAEALVREIEGLGRRATCLYADVADKEAVGRVVGEIDATFGRLDVLVLNAARAPFKETWRLFERDLVQLVETNLYGPVFCLQRALPLLERRGGDVVFVSSLGSRFMNPQYPLGPLKAAMEAMIRQWGEELRDKRVRANAVCAGLAKTDAFKTLRRLWRGLDELPDELFVRPEEIAGAVALLTHPDAAGITGQTIVVDRGLSNRLLRAPDAPRA